MQVGGVLWSGGGAGQGSALEDTQSREGKTEWQAKLRPSGSEGRAWRAEDSGWHSEHAQHLRSSHSLSQALASVPCIFTTAL